MTPLQALETEILSLHNNFSLRPTLETVREIGERLLKAKELVGHGRWLAWLARVGIRSRTAQVYMQVAKTQDSADLPERVSLDGFLSRIRMARRAARREAFREEQRRARDAADDADCRVEHADCRTFAWPDEVDVVATDPPWRDIDHYRWLAGFAASRLRDGGLLLVQCGVAGLADVLEVNREAGLAYQHTLSITYAHASGGTLLHPFQSNWRPVLLFSRGAFRRKGVTAFSDVYTVPKSPKRHHPWEQPLPPWEYWLGRLTRPGDLVADCFAGSGTIGVACKRFGRRYLGTEVDATHTETARRRLAGESRPDDTAGPVRHGD